MESEISTRLDQTLQKLQARLEEQEDVLENLRVSAIPFETHPSSELKAHLQQLRVLKIAYESATPITPYIPSPDSAIPSLLALRVTNLCIKDTEACTSSTETDLQTLQKRLEKEQSDLSDAKLIQTGLQTRVSSLNSEIEEQTQKNSAQIAKEMIHYVKRKQKYYDMEIGKLIQAFNEFIDEELAPMLAAEELGGPIVGAIQHIDDEMLVAGFSNHGKAKKPSKKVNGDKHQQRIDQIWGAGPKDDNFHQPWNEKTAAAAEMRDLTEQLLNSLVETEGNGPGAYIELPRESAASRFLVRSKVAQFHPKDASKLRLIDFGGALDDKYSDWKILARFL